MGIIVQLSEDRDVHGIVCDDATCPRPAQVISVYHVPDADRDAQASHRRMWSNPVKVKHWEEHLDMDTHIFFCSPSCRVSRPTERPSPCFGAGP